MGISTTRYNGIDESAPPGLMSPEQLAEYLGIGRTFAYQLLAQKRIPSFTIDKLRRIRKADVDRYIEHRFNAEPE
jgi:excisionase family DNA binding protein